LRNGMSVRVVCMPVPGKPEAAYNAVNLGKLGISNETVTADAGFYRFEPLNGSSHHEIHL